MEKENRRRRHEEFDALHSIYGEDLLECESLVSELGPWKIRVGNIGDCDVILTLTLPSDYPSYTAPSPSLKASPWVLDTIRANKLISEMKEMWSADTEIAIVWAEHIRAVLADIHQDENEKNEEGQDSSLSENLNEGIRCFMPSTSKYGQSIRYFQESVILNDANRRKIYHSKPFHPPRSGSSETMISHVAHVTSMAHIDWVLAELLLNDKKVAKASHNMIAFNFFDDERNCFVSDNDDDGEKGSGSKLAALLEITDSKNVLVVVSRWFGGVLLGSRRFKYIASVAREALEEAGFITGKKKKDFTTLKNSRN